MSKKKKIIIFFFHHQRPHEKGHRLGPEPDFECPRFRQKHQPTFTTYKNVLRVDFVFCFLISWYHKTQLVLHSTSHLVHEDDRKWTSWSSHRWLRRVSLNQEVYSGRRWVKKFEDRGLILMIKKTALCGAPYSPITCGLGVCHWLTAHCWADVPGSVDFPRSEAFTTRCVCWFFFVFFLHFSFFCVCKDHIPRGWLLLLLFFLCCLPHSQLEGPDDRSGKVLYEHVTGDYRTAARGRTRTNDSAVSEREREGNTAALTHPQPPLLTPCQRSSCGGPEEEAPPGHLKGSLFPTTFHFCLYLLDSRHKRPCKQTVQKEFTHFWFFSLSLFQHWNDLNCYIIL